MVRTPTVGELQDLCEQGCLKALILNLYPYDQGYSLTLPGKNCVDCVTETFPYSQTDLLDCVEQSQVPWFLADLLETCPITVYHQVRSWTYCTILFKNIINEFFSSSS